LDTNILEINKEKTWSQRNLGFRIYVDTAIGKYF
jgi:hypothetical protein